MPTEIEAKFRCHDPEALRQRLSQLDAVAVGTVLEHNEIFDTPTGTLRTADCGLRLRIAKPVAGASSRRVTLTYKGPRRVDALKSREELETTVGDAVLTRALLARLGYTPRVEFEKRRETWRLSDATIELDELPQLGWWIEIEGRDAGTVDAARTALGLGAEPVAEETYVEMAARAGKEDEGGVRRLVFEE